MKICWKARRAGKTAEAIKEAARTGAYILTRNRDHSLEIAKRAEEMKLQIRFPVTYEEMLQSRMSTGFVRDLIIDDLDAILERVFPFHNIRLVTITGGKHETRNDGS